MNESNDNLDDILNEYTKKNKIYNAYFVIDECHNYFDNQDKVKMWWLTYHRHLHHEIDFITQNKTLIHTKYRTYLNFLYKLNLVLKQLVKML